MNRDLVLVAAIILYYVLNWTAFYVFGADKRKAVRGKYRISERTLIILGLFGPFGALAGMKTFRHKTQNTKFKAIYLFAVMHLIFMALILWLLYF
jgi:uncharacterized membrane protein YsdA (DUF1294 family)